MARLVIAALVAVLATPMLSACSPMDVTAGPSLDGSHWVLEAMPGWESTKAPRVPTLAFKTGSAFGASGCNSWSGSYEQSGAKLKFKELASTAMACAYGMEVEGQFSQALLQTRSFEQAGEKLKLYDAQHHELARFFKASLVPPG